MGRLIQTLKADTVSACAAFPAWTQVRRRPYKRQSEQVAGGWLAPKFPEMAALNGLSGRWMMLLFGKTGKLGL